MNSACLSEKFSISNIDNIDEYLFGNYEFYTQVFLLYLQLIKHFCSILMIAIESTFRLNRIDC
ncbi:hypothetical protein HQ49_06895 [Porphyromonas gulae]|nr:hypothetical protein HQ49_06895 [Porphyromonas gulae]